MGKNIYPTKKDYLYWERYECGLMTEVRQCEEEGKEIAAYKNLAREIEALPSSPYKTQMADIFSQIAFHAPHKADYAYNEPSDFSEISAVITECPAIAYDKATIKDKLKGAWLGRICGCLLGKPIEGIKTEDLIPFLKKTNNYPMKRYITKKEILANTEEDSWLRQPHYGAEYTWADLVECAPVDDDTNYTVLSQLIVEKHGRDFSPSNVLDEWLRCQPPSAYCTAENIAWRNYLNGYEPPHTAIYKNPYREWIGAQIRIDYFGYINPGNVKEAIRMAYNDACISHVKNGIYGAMYIAAMIAYAAVCNDTVEVVRAGISQVPPKSRLYEEVNKLLQMYLSGKTQADCRKYIHAKFNEHIIHDWCHTVSNALVVTMALLYNQDDFGLAISAAAETGFDTDCNGATVGSIFGMMHGSECVSEAWLAPVRNKLQTTIQGYEYVDIDTLVEKTLAHLA